MVAPAVATDKSSTKAHFDTDTITADACGFPKNTLAQMQIDWPGCTPARHKLLWLIGSSVPDNTDYTDALAPIGSLFTHLKITAGVVVGAALYMKGSAGTWVVIGLVAAA